MRLLIWFVTLAMARPALASFAGEDERIAAHLERVERVLRSASVEHLTPRLRAARALNLDRLTAYRAAGEFPRNTYRDGRVPVFVDRTGRRCAVGALAEADLGARAIEAIAARFRLSTLAEIEDRELDTWAASSGLTLGELAMIQPKYGPTKQQRLEATVSDALAQAEVTCLARHYPAWTGPAFTHSLDLKLTGGKLELRGVGEGAPNGYSACLRTTAESFLAKHTPLADLDQRLAMRPRRDWRLAADTDEDSRANDVASFLLSEGAREACNHDPAGVAMFTIVLTVDRSGKPTDAVVTDTRDGGTTPARAKAGKCLGERARLLRFPPRKQAFKLWVIVADEYTLHGRGKLSVL